MKRKLMTITIDAELLQRIDAQDHHNRSRYIEELIKKGLEASQ